MVISKKLNFSIYIYILIYNKYFKNTTNTNTYIYKFIMNEYTILETKQFRGCGFMTICKYNNTGDIIYIGDKDSKIITAIGTQDYNIIGTFYGHNGIVWSLDISKDDNILVSASGDLTIGFFEAKIGTKIHQFNCKCIPKYVCIQKNQQTTNLAAIICEALTKKSSTYICIYDLDNVKNDNFDEKTKLLWTRQSKPNVMLWLSDEELLIGCDDGKIIQRNIYDVNGEMEKEYQIHSGSIKSMVWNKNFTQILTGSLDCTSQQIDISNGFKITKIFKSSVPVNWAIWNHNNKKVILGGGIEAMNVAKTSDNDLNIKIYKSTDQKLTHHIGSHFGPIRYIDKSPQGKNFISASQDGSVKIYLVIDEETNQNIDSKQESEPNPNQNINISLQLARFGDGLNYNVKLKSETNKMINLSWKPPKIKEQVVKNWIPGMPIPKDNSDDFKVNGCSYIDSRLEELRKKEAEQNSTIRITNLPHDIGVKDLAELFDLYGRIEERGGIKIKNYGDSTMAFIKYVYTESALKAIDNMDGYPLDHYIIKVELAIQR